GDAGGGNPGMMFMQAMMGGQQQKREERVRVVADPGINALLIKANALDMLTIRDLLENELDKNDNDSAIKIKTHYIALKVANAYEVAYVIQRVYSESTSQANLQRAAIAGFSGFQIGEFRGPSGGGNNSVLLTMAVDERSNGIVVACPEELYKEIEKLIN